MNTIQLNKEVQRSQGDGRENNFNIVRFVAAVFVFAGHMGIIQGGTPPQIGGFRMHEMGVSILFLISGYLITKSWLSDPDPLRFAVRRFFRFWIPFAVMILLMVFVAGPLVSELGFGEYFQGGYQTYLKNLRLLIIYALPGVFTNLPMANVTNGSLWTMPVEAALYVLTPLLLTLLRVKSRSRSSLYSMAAATGLAFGFDVYLRIFNSNSVVFYGTDMISAYHLMVLYMIGMLFTYEEVRRYLNMQVGYMAMCVLFLVQFSAGPLQYFLMYLIIPYVVFSFAFAPQPVFGRFGRKMELSYGIYLYGFFFQQLVVSVQQHKGIILGYSKTLLLSGLLTLVAAMASYYWVEMPSMRLGHFLVKKLKK